MDMNCLLIRDGEHVVLVETGAGPKLNDKQKRNFGVEGPPRLLAELAARGVRPDEVTLVINTHLHFDHAGGNTVQDNGSGVVPAFRKAKYFVQRGEYEDALLANERTRASYRQENFAPIAQGYRWEFLEGDREVLPGLSVMVTHGHTAHHQAVKIESEGKVALYLGDLIPTISHLPLPYIMGYDLYPLQTLETKRKVLDRAFQEKWLLMFEHDPRVQMGYVKKDIEGKYYLEEVRA